MNSTNVPSNENQTTSQTEFRAITIGLDRGKEVEYETVSGANKRSGIKDLIFQYLHESDILVGDATLGEDGILRTKNGNIAMKSPNAYQNVKNNGQKRNKLQDREVSSGIDR